MDDRSSSVNAVSNSSRRVSALQESDVQILLFCSNGGAGRGGGRDQSSQTEETSGRIKKLACINVN